MERAGRMLSDTGIEENTLAILDSTGIKDAKDEVDDRLSFLEAVRAASLAPDAGVAPTSKMCEAIFRILREGKNLELCMGSYQLLMDINKRFPRLIAPSVEVSSSSTPVDSELVVVREAWCPFVCGLDIPASTRGESSENCNKLIDSCGFRQLLENLVEEGNRSNKGIKSLGNMLLLDYLVNVLEGDFLPRRDSYKETTNWAIVRDSQLNLILDCVTLLSTLQNQFTSYSHGISDSEESKPINDCDASVMIALLEMKKRTCLAVRKLLLMIMELDELKKSADMHLQTTRGDSVRTPAFEIILDELTYNTDALFQFLQAFDEPKWKLELAVQYLRKYIAKPSVRTRRKIRSSEVLEFLLANAFQAYLSISIGMQLADGTGNSSEILQGNSKEEVCKGVISAFQSLKKADQHVGTISIGKEALFAAATLLSLK
ncbi:unnamed protein product [Rhodiola kirilowii]